MKLSRPTLATVLSIALITPAGFATKFYHGPAEAWVANSFGGVLYEIFWCLALFLARPRLTPAAIAATVFAVTCALEFLQLWHPPFLETIRATFLGAALIGTTFVPSDFACYAAGSAVGCVWVRALRQSRPDVRQ